MQATELKDEFDFVEKMLKKVKNTEFEEKWLKVSVTLYSKR